MGDFKLPTIKNFTETGKKVTKKTTVHFKTHWLDYLLLFFICFVLGAFDIFVLKQSQRLFKQEYWTHAGCRMAAYVLAGILGIRLGYPKFKAECEDLAIALEKNRKLIIYKEVDGNRFGDFIYDINIRVKKSAWKYQITNRLKKLDKKNPSFFPLWYIDKDEKHFERFKPTEKCKFKKVKQWKYNRIKAEAVKYRHNRDTLEKFLTDEYIDKNIHVLDVKYPIVDKNHFARIDCDNLGYEHYKTTADTTGNAAKKILNILLVSSIITLLIGAIAIDLDKQLLEDRVLGIFRIIINAILDIGLTIWQFVKCYLYSEKIVRQEDLRSVLDQNELLTEYKKSLPAELIAQAESEIVNSVVKTETENSNP